METAPVHSVAFASLRRQRGLSLVELMIGVVVGLLVTLAVLGSVGTISAQRKTSVAGNNARESAQAAVAVIEDAARIAGSGLFYNGALMCTTLNSYYQTAVTRTNATLAPLLITDGGSAASDKITVAYGDPKGGSSVSHLVDDMPAAANVYTVGNRGGLQVGDLAVISVPGTTHPCTLFQVTGFNPGGGTCNGLTTACEDILHSSGTGGDYNPPNFNTAWGAYSKHYGHETSGSAVGPAVISRIGTFHNDVYEVMCDSLVSYPVGTTAGCSTSPLTFTGGTPLVANVVQVQAQYGISDTADSDVVTSWVDATAAAGWNAPSAAQIPRIKAIRIAVVSRSPEPALTTVTAACTNAASVANTGPCSFEDAQAPVIDLSAVTVPAGKTWQNYRYRVYTSIIPLRNVLWNY